jgi:hypothetical protein
MQLLMLLHGNSGYTNASQCYGIRTLRSAVAQWLKYCATNWKVTGSMPDGVIGVF